MKTVGIIAEYNPFHNGHLYHIQKAKELTKAEHVIVIMSGNFVQRGTPAILDKFSRTKMALSGGADLVIELPTIYATGSAESFAYGSVALLDRLNGVDYLCFGSECGHIKFLQEIAGILVTEPKEYLAKLKSLLKDGISFPLAREKSLVFYLKRHINSLLTEVDIKSILSNPNNILGIEYCKALIKLSSKIKPLTISRVDSGYHSTDLGTCFSSASSIRKHILESNSFDYLLSQVPTSTFSILKEDFQNSYPVVTNDFSDLLYYKLQLELALGVDSFLDVSPSLANRIQNSISQYISFDQFCGVIKSKDLTYTRINRSLLHILLNITTESFEDFMEKGTIPYARVLGMNRNASKLLSRFKKESNLPLVMKLSSQMKTLPSWGQEMLQQDIFATQIYHGILSRKWKTQPYNEYKTELIFMESI